MLDLADYYVFLPYLLSKDFLYLVLGSVSWTFLFSFSISGYDMTELSLVGAVSVLLLGSVYKGISG